MARLPTFSRMKQGQWNRLRTDRDIKCYPILEMKIVWNYSDERVLCSAPQTSSEKRTWERYLV